MLSQLAFAQIVLVALTKIALGPIAPLVLGAPRAHAIIANPRDHCKLPAPAQDTGLAVPARRPSQQTSRTESQEGSRTIPLLVGCYVCFVAKKMEEEGIAVVYLFLFLHAKPGRRS